ncbi:MAG: DUF5688 family protein [Lachnospiraceae bacterium]|nr:DUF5688 family protein [Lachnospiraceae bacterium]
MNSTASPVLDMDTFIRALVHSISATLGPDVEITTSEQQKNNQVTYSCLTIRHPDRKISPNIRIDELFDTYKSGQMDITEISDRISAAYNNISQETNVIEEFVSDPKGISDRVFFRLINYERNCESLASYPHFRILDLAIVFCLNIPLPDEEYGAVRIDNRIASMMELDAAGLLSLAVKNTPVLYPPEFESLDNILIGLMKRKGVPEYLIPVFVGESMHSPMKVLSNKQEYYGAGCILYPGVLEKIREEMGTDFFILPSSINEVIIVPAEASQSDKLVDMVRDVNSTVIPPDQILSDNVYRYPQDFGPDVIGPLFS